MKLEKLLVQQAALAKQIDAARKAESQAKKKAAAALAQARKSAVLHAAEKAGLMEFSPDLLSAEFKKISATLAKAAAKHAPEFAAQTQSNFTHGE